MSKTIDLFKVPVHFSELSIDNEKFIKELKTIKVESRIISNKGGYQSKNLPLKHKSLKQFSKLVLEETNKFANSIDLKPIKKINNIWLNINHYKDFNIAHDHPGCIFSGVYYLNTPENCGNIKFLNPVMDHLQYYWEQNLKTHNCFTSSEWWLPSKSGRLYIFPHFLKHYVEPNMNKDEPRASLSFNLS